MNPYFRSKRITEAEIKEERLSRRLCYILRYGAKKEGLQLYAGDFVNIDDILRVEMMSKYTSTDIMDLAAKSKSPRGMPRFEVKPMTKHSYKIKANHFVNMEDETHHEDSNIPKLTEMCVNYVCKNITSCNLDDFADIYLHGRMVRKLKREKRLNNTILPIILIPSLERLNLCGVYLTSKSFVIIIERGGKNLRVLNLNGSGYVLIDHIMERLMMKMSALESLNISGCTYLTDRSLKAIIKFRPKMRHLNASGCTNLTSQGILDLIQKCPQLEYLDIYDHKGMKGEERKRLVEMGSHRELTVILKGFTNGKVGVNDPDNVLDIWLDT